jgi:hypothetical protein
MEPLPQIVVQDRTVLAAQFVLGWLRAFLA